MTDEEVMEVLVKRQGIEVPIVLDSPYWADAPDYLGSKDALQPVLEKLSPEELRALTSRLVGPISLLHQAYRRLLTVPAKDLAHTIAEAIKEIKK